MIPITEIIIPSKNPERIRAKTTFIVEESEFKKKDQSFLDLLKTLQ
jgi:hypothetical protein